MGTRWKASEKTVNMTDNGTRRVRIEYFLPWYILEEKGRIMMPMAMAMALKMEGQGKQDKEEARNPKEVESCSTVRTVEVSTLQLSGTYKWYFLSLYALAFMSMRDLIFSDRPAGWCRWWAGWWLVVRAGLARV